MKLPRAILFDLDDTILVAFGPAQSQWQRTIAAFADGHCGGDGPLGPLRQPYTGNGGTPKIGACPPNISR